MSQLKKYERLNLILAIIFVAGLLAIFTFQNRSNNIQDYSQKVTSAISTKTASAQEIYPLFECPCCGKPIDECTCSMAVERRAYIDGLTEAGMDYDKVVITYVQKYGLDSFVDKSKTKELREKLIQEAPADRPIIALSPDSYDFGDISQTKGLVTTLFELKNEGQDDLIISRLETSCGCTSASIIYQGQESPRFGMPGYGLNENIDNWQLVIPAGQTAQLKVYYDPNVHQDFRGPAIRKISVFSNDPIDFQKSVQIELNQVD